MLHINKESYQINSSKSVVASMALFPTGQFRRSAYAAAAVVAILALTLGGAVRIDRPRLVVEPRTVVIPADGEEHRVVVARLRRRGGGFTTLAAQTLTVSGIETRLVESDGAVAVWVHVPVSPGETRMRLVWHEDSWAARVRGGGAQSVVVPVRFAFDAADSFADGTPDFLRLHTADDRRAFRRWFTAIAEAEANLPPEKLPPEIGDCAALLRFAYRETLLAHDERWLLDRMDSGGDARMQGMASIAQYRYPQTPLGAGLFRVKEGAFAATDVANGSFAQFADAKTLMERNTHRIGRQIQAARPGDLLFFRQLEQNSPYHSMIVIESGNSGTGNHDGAASGVARWVVYHTGPIGSGKGEMRRVLLDDLLHHPDARWHPVPENTNFLGVYRWNILREDD